MIDQDGNITIHRATGTVFTIDTTNEGGFEAGMLVLDIDGLMTITAVVDSTDNKFATFTFTAEDAALIDRPRPFQMLHLGANPMELHRGTISVGGFVRP